MVEQGGPVRTRPPSCTAMTHRHLSDHLFVWMWEGACIVQLSGHELMTWRLAYESLWIDLSVWWSALTTRHIEHQYARPAQDLLQKLQGAMRGTGRGRSYTLGNHIWHHSSRVGPFEVYLFTPPSPPRPEGGASWWENRGYSWDSPRLSRLIGQSKVFDRGGFCREIEREREDSCWMSDVRVSGLRVSCSCVTDR